MDIADFFHKPLTNSSQQPKKKKAKKSSKAKKDDEEDDDGNTQLIVVRFDHDRCTISADSSGALLHRRGWRQAIAKAPLRETLAAQLIMLSRWDARTEPPPRVLLEADVVLVAIGAERQRAARVQPQERIHDGRVELRAAT